MRAMRLSQGFPHFLWLRRCHVFSFFRLDLVVFAVANQRNESLTHWFSANFLNIFAPKAAAFDNFVSFETTIMALIRFLFYADGASWVNRLSIQAEEKNKERIRKKYSMLKARKNKSVITKFIVKVLTTSKKYEKIESITFLHRQLKFQSVKKRVKCGNKRQQRKAQRVGDALEHQIFASLWPAKKNGKNINCALCWRFFATQRRE